MEIVISHPEQVKTVGGFSSETKNTVDNNVDNTRIVV